MPFLAFEKRVVTIGKSVNSKTCHLFWYILSILAMTIFQDYSNLYSLSETVNNRFLFVTLQFRLLLLYVI
jgi:hypothetical protein